MFHITSLIWIQNQIIFMLILTHNEKSLPDWPDPLFCRPIVHLPKWFWGVMSLGSTRTYILWPSPGLLTPSLNCPSRLFFRPIIMHSKCQWSPLSSCSQAEIGLDSDVYCWVLGNVPSWAGQLWVKPQGLCFDPGWLHLALPPPVRNLWNLNDSPTPTPTYFLLASSPRYE